MALSKVLKRIFNIPLSILGMEVIRKGSWKPYNSVRFPTDMERMQHAADLGFKPKVIYDGGGFDGKWCAQAASIFQDAEFVMFEPNPTMKARIIDRVAPIKTRVQLIQKALGESPGTAKFNIWSDGKVDAGASLLNHVKGDASTQLEVEVVSIDSVAEETGKWPDLIKIDLQGAEAPALRGAAKALDRAEMVIAEFGCLEEAYEGRTTPAELISMMDKSGYKLYDLVDIHYRPHDGALTGGDLFFVKRSSALNAHKGYN